MKQEMINIKRRNILKKGLLGLTAVATSSVIPMQVQAGEMPELTEDDPMAIGLAYKKDASTVDAAKYEKYAEDQNCANCTLYTAKSDELGQCTIFAGKQVRAKGWCNAYVKKA